MTLRNEAIAAMNEGTLTYRSRLGESVNLLSPATALDKLTEWAVARRFTETEAVEYGVEYLVDFGAYDLLLLLADQEVST